MYVFIILIYEMRREILSAMVQENESSLFEKLLCKYICKYTYIHIYVYVYICIYIYIFIESSRNIIKHSRTTI